MVVGDGEFSAFVVEVEEAVYGCADAVVEARTRWLEPALLDISSH